LGLAKPTTRHQLSIGIPLKTAKNPINSAGPDDRLVMPLADVSGLTSERALAQSSAHECIPPTQPFSGIGAGEQSK
jgi:hypothetical protein